MLEVETKNLTAAEEVQLIALLQKCGMETVEAGMAAPTSVVTVTKKLVPVKKLVVGAATEVVEVVEKKRGHPPKLEGAMSVAERARLYRERKKSSRS